MIKPTERQGSLSLMERLIDGEKTKTEQNDAIWREVLNRCLLFMGIVRLRGYIWSLAHSFWKIFFDKVEG